MGFCINKGDYIKLVYDEKETDAVKYAINNLRRDLMRVLNARINADVNQKMVEIYVGCAGVADYAACCADLPKEAFVIRENEGRLYICGADRRGTIYGIYDFCQSVLGVSPWYFFADVPVKEKLSVELPRGYEKTDYPTIEYRGIFINDEEELEHWVQRYMGEETIGVKTYEHIFELLLRLKLNYIWPAMHVNSFNIKQENGALANRMGIVVGTSHCDMLMRSNNREWKPWTRKKGYEDVEYDYSIPGRNREILQEYWRESVEQNKNFEVSYTLGMRGIHDSGFEVRGLAGKTGEELLQAKIQLLTDVMSYQYEMLGEVLQKDTQKNFVPYKEVLELYDNGLEVPEDMTLIWVNDNYGYVRRYPGDKEKARKGGNGIYFHNSYWAPPGNSYLFICSIPLAHTRNELKKAYEEGIRKLWVTNFGAIKPLEQQLSFYAKYAWEAGREETETEDEQLFLENWINETFSGNYGKELAPLLTKFDQLTNVRKLEHMDSDVFSQVSYGDEGAGRLHEYEEMFERVNRIHERLPRQERDAFFQMVAMKIHAAYYTYAMYYYADRSVLCMKQGKLIAAEKYTKLSLEYDHARRSMLYYYNNVMSNGKWAGILTPEDFPPPRTNMHPAAMPPLSVPEKELKLVVWGDEEKLTFVTGKKKWFELAGGGEGEILCKIKTPSYLNLQCEGFEESRGVANGESRVFVGSVAQDSRFVVWVDKDNLLVDKKGAIEIYDMDSGVAMELPIEVFGGFGDISHVEEDGYVVVEACDYVAIDDSFKEIANLGRGKGSLLEGRTEGATVSYDITLRRKGEHTLELHRFPTLNSVGRLRIGVSVDGGEVQVLESFTNDEHKGNWKSNVQNNVDKITLQLPLMGAGNHSITFHVIDKYVSFSRFVIYTGERKEASLVYDFDNQTLPKEWDLQGFVKEFYGEEAGKLLPRPVLYLPVSKRGDTLCLEDISISPQWYGGKVLPQYFLEQGQTLFGEEEGAVHIDMASALAGTEYASMEGNGWLYCNSPSYGESGLAMYIREEGLHYEPSQAPKLRYQIAVHGGKYMIWIRTFCWGNDALHFTLSLDGKVLTEKELYKGKMIWGYSSENVWKWIPAVELEMSAGQHILEVYALSSRLRMEQLYITSGEELPPATP